MKKITVLLALVALFCTHQAEAAPLHVVVSFSILADMVAETGGSDVDVRALVGPNADTHTYQPTPDDAKLLAKADLVIINGLGFEGWMQRLIEASGYKGKVIVASQGVTPRTIEEGIDPHAWQDLANGRIYIKNIADALIQIMPDRALTLQARATHYDSELVKTALYVKEQFADIPLAKRKVITSHDAFGYFGAAYGITFLAPAGMSTDEAEPAALDIAKLVDQIKKEKVSEIFLENMSSPKLMTQIAKDSGAQMGGTLYSDALSDKSGEAPDYISMFYNNVPKLRAAMLKNGQ